jgi:hypothetical protein
MPPRQKIRDDDKRGSPKGRYGQPKHVRNEAAAEQIELLAGFGLPKREIGQAVEALFKDQGYSEDTIERHYRDEWDRGLAVAKSKLLIGANDIAFGRLQPEGVTPDRLFAERARKIEWLLGAVHKVAPVQSHRLGGPEGGAIPVEYRNLSDDELDARIAEAEKKVGNAGAG